MNCAEALARLEDYSYGELGDRESVQLAAHMRDCARCYSAYELIMSENEQFFNLADCAPSAQMWEVVQARITILAVPQSPVSVFHREIFTLIEFQPLWVRVVNELRAAAEDFRQDPAQFIIDLCQGDPLQAKGKRYLRAGMVASAFVWTFSFLLYAGWAYTRPVAVAGEGGQLEKVTDLLPFHVPELASGDRNNQRAGGGGGGGREEMPPPSRGRLPQATLTPPIVAPSTHPAAIKQPSLPVVPTIQVQPELVAQQSPGLPLGLPSGVPGPPSDGSGEGGGIGVSKGGGIGAGNGTGLGPGASGNTSGGGMGIGSGGDAVYMAGETGVRPPQILRQQRPKYTEEARRNKIKGVVVLNAVFRADGTMSDISIIRGLGYGLDEEAIKAGYLIKFIPGQKDGKPVNVRARLEFVFSLL